jgi:hypothetical protein
MSHDPTAYYLILPQNPVNHEVQQVLPPERDQAGAVVFIPDTQLPPARQPVAEVSAPAAEQVFSRLEPVTGTPEHAGKPNPEVKPHDEADVAGMVLLWTGAWALAEHLEDLNKVHDDEEWEEEDTELDDV